MVILTCFSCSGAASMYVKHVAHHVSEFWWRCNGSCLPEHSGMRCMMYSSLGPGLRSFFPRARCFSGEHTGDTDVGNPRRGDVRGVLQRRGHLRQRALPGGWGPHFSCSAGVPAPHWRMRYCTLASLHLQALMCRVQAATACHRIQGK